MYLYHGFYHLNYVVYYLNYGDYHLNLSLNVSRVYDLNHELKHFHFISSEPRNVSSEPRLLSSKPSNSSSKPWIQTHQDLTSSDFLQKVVLDTSPWISGETKECCLCIKQYTHIPIYFDYDIFAKNSALNRDLNLFCFIFYFIKNTENVCINCFFYSCNLKFFTPWSRNCHSEALKIRFIKVMCNHIDFQIFVKSGLQI